MKTIETRRYEMLVRVRDFGRTYANRFPESSYGRTLFADLESVVRQLGEHAVSRLSAARDGTATRNAARDALIAQLEAMNRIAQAVGPEIVGLAEKFQLPATEEDHVLIAAGRLFAQDAVPFEKEFVGHGMPATFLADLESRVSGLEQAIVASDIGNDAHVAARAAIDTTITAGMNTVRKIDALVRNVLGDDQTVMAVWERDRRVHYPRVRSERPPAAQAAPQSATPPAPEPVVMSATGEAPVAPTPQPAAQPVETSPATPASAPAAQPAVAPEQPPAPAAAMAVI